LDSVVLAVGAADVPEDDAGVRFDPGQQLQEGGVEVGEGLPMAFRSTSLQENWSAVRFALVARQSSIDG